MPAASQKIKSQPGNGVDLDNLKQIVRAFAGATR